MWTYAQKTGVMYDANDRLLATGYSGAGPYKNDPSADSVKDKGPLPCGRYKIKKPAVDTIDHGPEVLWLVPDPSNEMHGRSGFGIHGDSRLHPGCASEGCVIMPKFARDRINESQDDDLEVVAEFSSNAEDVDDAANGEK